MNDLANQYHIVLCPSYFNGNSESAKLDTRSIEEINRKGLKADKDLNALDNIYPSSRTILHELVHVVGGPELDESGRPLRTYSAIGAPQWIRDTPGVPCYGFSQCAKIKEAYDNEKNPEKKKALTPSRNADSYVSLCLGKILQTLNNAPRSC